MTKTVYNVLGIEISKISVNKKDYYPTDESYIRYNGLVISGKENIEKALSHIFLMKYCDTIKMYNVLDDNDTKVDYIKWRKGSYKRG